MQDNSRKLSQYLCFILRHHPDEIGVPRDVMDTGGWVNVNTLIQGINDKGKYNITHTVLEKIVEEDEKGRYKFDKYKSKIKCCQGHSVEWVIPELELREPPEFLYHGTNTESMAKIIQSGHISKMNRHAVHMQEKEDKAWQSAKRWHSTPVVLKIAALKLYKSGVQFGITENEVWCADDIPADYIVDYIYECYEKEE